MSDLQSIITTARKLGYRLVPIGEPDDIKTKKKVVRKKKAHLGK